MAARKSSKPTSKKTTKKVVKSAVSTPVKSSKKRFNLASVKTTQMNKKVIGGLVLALVLSLLVFRYKSAFVASFVNGKPIWRMSVVHELEKRSGSEVMDELVTKELINQEIKNRGITVTDQEIEDETNRIDKLFSDQGYTLDAALAQQGMTKDQFRENVYIQLALEKMVKDKIQVSDDEVQSYYDNNSDLYKDQKFDDVKADIRDTLSNNKLSKELSSLISNLKTSADIRTYVDY